MDEKNHIEINSSGTEGFSVLVSSGGWRVGVINSCERLLEKNLRKRERHLETDEVFLLLKGGATLFVGEEMREYPLVPGKTFNVKKGVWHCIALEPGASVAAA